MNVLEILLLLLVLCIIISFIISRIDIYYVDNTEQEPIEDNLIPIYVEKINETFMLYNANTDQFLAQGKNHIEIYDILSKRFPNTNFYATKTNLDAIGYKFNNGD